MIFFGKISCCCVCENRGPNEFFWFCNKPVQKRPQNGPEMRFF